MQRCSRATDAALAAEQPGPETIYNFVYSPDVDPTSEQFDTEDDPQFSGNETTMVDLLNACMKDEMRRDQKILVFGEDVADVSREEHSGRSRARAACSRSRGACRRNSAARACYNSPLGRSERSSAAPSAWRFAASSRSSRSSSSTTSGRRTCRSATSWRPCAGVPTATSASPVVIRVTYGGYIRGAIYHSQTGASLFTHCPGLRVVCPATALDANGLLRTAIRCDDPVIFLEHKHLYRQTYNKAAYPGPNFMIPFGKAKIVREGTDVTIVTYGATVQRAFARGESARRIGTVG